MAKSPTDETVDPAMAARPSPDFVRRRIEDEIRHSNLGPGDRLGAERELAERLDVSRWVVRRALDSLERDGVIRRVNGRGGGIFLAPQKVVRDLARLVGLPAYLSAQGLDSSTTVLSTGTIPADTDLARNFQVDVGEIVYKVVRLRQAGGTPLSIETCYFIASLFPGLLDQSLVGSLYDVLESAFNLDRGEASESLESVAADPEYAAGLQVPDGFPLLAVRRQARTAAGQVFEYSEEYYRGDRMTVTVHTRGSREFEPQSVQAR